MSSLIQITLELSFHLNKSKEPITLNSINQSQLISPYYINLKLQKFQSCFNINEGFHINPTVILGNYFKKKIDDYF